MGIFNTRYEMFHPFQPFTHSVSTRQDGPPGELVGQMAAHIFASNPTMEAARAAEAAFDICDAIEAIAEGRQKAHAEARRLRDIEAKRISDLRYKLEDQALTHATQWAAAKRAENEPKIAALVTEHAQLQQKLVELRVATKTTETAKARARKSTKIEYNDETKSFLARQHDVEQELSRLRNGVQHEANKIKEDFLAKLCEEAGIPPRQR